MLDPGAHEGVCYRSIAPHYINTHFRDGTLGSEDSGKLSGYSPLETDQEKHNYGADHRTLE